MEEEETDKRQQGNEPKTTGKQAKDNRETAQRQRGNGPKTTGKGGRSGVEVRVGGEEKRCDDENKEGRALDQQH